MFSMELLVIAHFRAALRRGFSVQVQKLLRLDCCGILSEHAVQDSEEKGTPQWR